MGRFQEIEKEMADLRGLPGTREPEERLPSAKTGNVVTLIMMLLFLVGLFLNGVLNFK